MPRVDDPALTHILDYAFANGIPDHVAQRAHEGGHVILCAASLADIAVWGPVLRWKSVPGKFGVQVDGKWHIIFAWDDAQGAYDLALKRR